MIAWRTQKVQPSPTSAAWRIPGRMPAKSCRSRRRQGGRAPRQVNDDGLGDAQRSARPWIILSSADSRRRWDGCRFFFDDECWEWSDEVQEIHGCAPGEMPNPTTEQVLSHKHPDDYAHVVGVRTLAAHAQR